MKWMRVLALILAVSLLLTGCGLPSIRRIDDLSAGSSSSSAAGKPSPAPTPKPTEEPVPEPSPEPSPEPEGGANAAWLEQRNLLLSGWESFGDLQYERPDIDALTEQITALTARAASETDAEDFFREYDALNDSYQHYATMNSLLTLLYDQDVTDGEYEAEMEWLSENSAVLFPMLSSMYEAIYGNETLYAWCMENWTEATVEYVGATIDMGDAEDLTVQEDALLLEFDRLQAEFSVPVGDQEWTLNDFYAYDGSGGITSEEFYDGYDRYTEEFNAAAGEIFLKLRDLRVEEAQRAGYDSFADYMYVSYGCDYSSDDLEDFCEAMKTYIAPLYEELYWSLYSDEFDRLYRYSYSLDDTLDALGSALQEIDPRLAESFELMLDRGMCDLEPSRGKNTGAYTTFLPDYGMPFILSSFTGSYWDVSTIVHEFGHFNSMARIPDCRMEEIDSIDLAEIDSQGLELLMFPYYDRLFTPSLADAARDEVLLNAMNSLLSGCMEDEFQRTVYANPDMTLEEMNRLYEELAAEYGQASTYGTTGNMWTMIPHTFSAPMYYISYALSMVSAMELWAESRDDWEGAVDKYLNFIDERGHVYSYRRALEAFGFEDPLTDSVELLSGLAEELEAYARFRTNSMMNGENAA